MKETLPANSLISHYLILSRLGAGGMGVVYLAEHTKLNRKVALKVWPASLAADQDHVAQAKGNLKRVALPKTQ